MRVQTLFAVLAVFASGRASLAGVCYEEQFGAHFVQYDLGWQPTGDPSRFFSSHYVTAPFEPSEAMEHHVCIQSDRMVRAGIIVSTIYNLDTGTVMRIRRDKHRYAVITFQQMLDLLTKTPVSARKTTTRINETGRSQSVANQLATEYDATVYSGNNILAHASIWKVAKLPLKGQPSTGSAVFKNSASPMHLYVR